MEPAEYEYKFQFQLAQQLPTSFEGVYGYVRYHVRARLDRGASAPIVFKRGFTVNNIVDLNADPRAAVCCQLAFIVFFFSFLVQMKFSLCYERLKLVNLSP